jgi:hypothetical protein
MVDSKRNSESGMMGNWEDELRDTDERITYPLRTATILSGYCLGCVLLVGFGKYVFYSGRLIAAPDWRWIASTIVGIIAVCFSYAYLGARIGRRKAQQSIIVVLVVGLIAGIWFLTRYLDKL